MVLNIFTKCTQLLLFVIFPMKISKIKDEASILSQFCSLPLQIDAKSTQTVMAFSPANHLQDVNFKDRFESSQCLHSSSRQLRMFRPVIGFGNKEGRVPYLHIGCNMRIVYSVSEFWVFNIPSDFTRLSVFKKYFFENDAFPSKETNLNIFTFPLRSSYLTPITIPTHIQLYLTQCHLLPQEKLHVTFLFRACRSLCFLKGKSLPGPPICRFCCLIYYGGTV